MLSWDVVVPLIGCFGKLFKTRYQTAATPDHLEDVTRIKTV